MAQRKIVGNNKAKSNHYQASQVELNNFISNNNCVANTDYKFHMTFIHELINNAASEYLKSSIKKTQKNTLLLF